MSTGQTRRVTVVLTPRLLAALELRQARLREEYSITEDLSDVILRALTAELQPEIQRNERFGGKGG